MARKALVLGTGLVSRPCIDSLIKTGFTTTCASAIQEELNNLVKVFPVITPIRLDVPNDKGILQDLIKDTNVVISLLPYHLHHIVALICIEEGKNLVTASYLDNAMRNLHEKAAAAGITIIVEAGLDPGLDHMIAMMCVDALKKDGGQISEFRSVCGGIPASESTAGSLKYKFSWFPKGVFLGALKPARCLLEGKVVEFENVLEHPEKVNSYLEDYNLECIPNRDALEYRDVYDIPEAFTLFRGTLRYQGTCRLWTALTRIGLMGQTAYPELASNAANLTWRELITVLLGLPTESTQERVEKAVLEKLNHDSEQLKFIQELGLLSNKTVSKNKTPLDSLCAHLESLFSYEHGEQDLVLMWVKVSAKLSSGKQRTLEATLVEKGTPVGGQSAMSKTVGLTAAFCADLLASGTFQRKGVILPITKDIYEPVLAKMSAEGITITRTVLED